MTILIRLFQRSLLLHALALGLALGTALSACDGGDETVDAASACTALCTDAQYASSMVEEYEHELNCACQQGMQDLVEADCASMCSDLGWDSGSVYASSAGSVNACQCS